MDGNGFVSGFKAGYRDAKPFGFGWVAFGIPAVLAWIAYGLCWLLEPRLTVEVSPIIWAMYAAGGWYGLLIVIFGGWLGVIALTGLLQ